MGLNHLFLQLRAVNLFLFILCNLFSAAPEPLLKILLFQSQEMVLPLPIIIVLFSIPLFGMKNLLSTCHIQGCKQL